MKDAEIAPKASRHCHAGKGLRPIGRRPFTLAADKLWLATREFWPGNLNEISRLRVEG
jgi:hypothetical protein